MLWGGVLEHVPFDQPVAFHTAQCLGQDLLGDARQSAAQFGVPLRASEQRVDEQDPPFGRQPLQRLPGGTAFLEDVGYHECHRLSRVEGHFKVPSGRGGCLLLSLPVMTELRIHTYTAAEPGLFVNSYLLETADGVVLVDAGLLVSDARALAA